MRPLILALALSLPSLVVSAATPAPAPSASRLTLEVSVEGLNCALCSEEMRKSLAKVANATDLEPKLECGRIYLELDPKTALNEGALSFALMANGFNFKGVRPISESLAQVRARKESC